MAFRLPSSDGFDVDGRPQAVFSQQQSALWALFCFGASCAGAARSSKLDCALLFRDSRRVTFQVLLEGAYGSEAVERGRNSVPVLIIDEHPIVANAIEGALADIDDSLAITICHSAGSAIDVFRRIPHWYRILLDLDVPGAHGMALARQFHAWGVADRCAIITATDDPSWIVEAKRLGMIAYIVKSMPLDAFATGLRSILDGKRVFPEVASRDDPGVRLTGRQRDVLSLLCRGYSTKEIAVKRSLAVGTVDNHIANAMRTLQVRNRTHAITRAIALGMIDGCEGRDAGFAPGECSVE